MHHDNACNMAHPFDFHVLTGKEGNVKPNQDLLRIYPLLYTWDYTQGYPLGRKKSHAFLRLLGFQRFAAFLGFAGSMRNLPKPF